MATLSNMGIPLVSDSILHPKHKNRFRVRFFGMGFAEPRTEALSAQVVTANRPTLEFEELTLDRYNSRAYVAGKHSWTEFQCTIEDDLSNQATAIIGSQVEAQQSLIGGTARNPNWLNAAPTASYYKFVTWFEMLNGNEDVAERWVMEGCWLKTAEYGEVDYAASEQMTISLTIRYDHAYQVLDINGKEELPMALGGY